MLKRFFVSFIFALLVVVLTSMFLLPTVARVMATDEVSENDEWEYANPMHVYNIVDEYGYLVSTKSGIQLGDRIITRSFDVFEIVEIDDNTYLAHAVYVETLPKPIVKRRQVGQISNQQFEKKISLYCTHNDECYVTGDGTDSIWGAGGIHDIARLLQSNLVGRGVNVHFDETLHIPHNSTAYSRSSVTAQRLLNENSPDALFDIHRDGVPKSAYRTYYNGEEKCQVAIVVGNANPNKAITLQFALYLMSVADEICPWLFTDIHYASGHYNQALSNKALLLECGTYLYEKNKVVETIPFLADVIYTTLYGTTVEEETGDLSIGEETNEPNSVNNLLEQETIAGESNNTSLWIILGVLTFCGGLTVLIAALWDRSSKLIDFETEK